MKESWLHRAFHEEGPLRFRVDLVVYILIAISVLLLTLEVSFGTDHHLVKELRVVDHVLLYIFAVEIGLRVVSYHPPRLDFYDYTGRKRLWANVYGRCTYLLNPWILLDLITVLAFVPELRSLRALRLLRLLRGFKLFRYSNPFLRLGRALGENRLLFFVGFILIGLSTLVGGLTVYAIEVQVNPQMNTIADGLWWALVTLTTVGFGDITPVSAPGRILGAVLMLIGMMNLGLFAAIVAHTLPKALIRVREEQVRMSGYLNHWVVCGYESGTEMFLRTLVQELDGDETILLFGEGERPDGVPGAFIWLEGDPQKESELDKLRLEYAAGVILVARRSISPQQADAATILTAFTIRSYLNKHPVAMRQNPLFMVAEVLDGENSEHLITAGVDEVVETNRLGFSLLSHAMTMPGTARVMSQMAEFGQYSLYVGRDEQMSEPMDFLRVSQRLKHDHKALLVGFRKPDGGEFINPDETVIVHPEDILIYLAESPVLETCT